MTAKHDAEPPLAVQHVRALMDRHGLPRYRQSTWLADAVGISYSQAHRRMTGVSPWTLEELAQVAALFGESLSDVILHRGDGTESQGLLQLGANSVRCSLWVGERYEQAPHPGEIVAVRSSEGWKALHASEAGDGFAYKVTRIDIRPGSASRRSVAVLDDDRDLSDGICAHLTASGYDAKPFYKSAELIASFESNAYDAFIVDWIVGHANALDLIVSLRARQSSAPIIVLTGQMITGVVDEREIAAAVKEHDLVFHEKPVRLSILSATLTRAFPPR